MKKSKKALCWLTTLLQILVVPRQQCMVEKSAGKNLLTVSNIQKVKEEASKGDKLPGDAHNAPSPLAILLLTSGQL